MNLMKTNEKTSCNPPADAKRYSDLVTIQTDSGRIVDIEETLISRGGGYMPRNHIELQPPVEARLNWLIDDDTFGLKLGRTFCILRSYRLAMMKYNFKFGETHFFEQDTW